MPIRVAVRLFLALLSAALAAPGAVGYIHFPPMTLPKMCKESHQIRVLSVKKHSREKGVILFEVAETLSGKDPKITSFKHVIRADGDGVKPILDWVGDGKKAVMFSIEANPSGKGKESGIGYVFIDEYCYSACYNCDAESWDLIRAEPDLSACYHGSVDVLRKTIGDILAGREVKVPVKVPAAKEDQKQRHKEVNRVLDMNQKK